MYDELTPRELKAAAKAEINGGGIEGFGIGSQTLRIYVRNADSAKDLPSIFRGWPVEVVIVGNIEANSNPLP